jgi:hypothetical protein
MPTKLAERALVKCTIAGVEEETKAPRSPLLTLVHTSLVPPVHSPKLAAHTLQSQTSAQDAPLKPCVRQLAGACSPAGGHEATLFPRRSNRVGAGRWAL